MSFTMEDVGKGESVRYTSWHVRWDSAIKFGRVLKRRRMEAGFSQPLLALRCEITPTYVSEMERGVKVPSMITMHSLACVLNTTIGDMMKEAGI